ncbi:MAG TPA: glycerophosphodiester phosphodiesterase family protein [Actinomycetota bacterium]|nr:glycerophosphodiester phosphodiesterase family protein [Actinomycetota bacterium]
MAHRGASAEAPENTLAAIEAAASARADLVEIDVRLTADGIPVVLHDPDVGPTTDGTGFVHTMTLAEVKRLDASGGRGPRQEVPTVAEALESIGDHSGMGVDLEIKNIPGEPGFDSRETVVEAALQAVKDVGFPGLVLVSSFNWLTIERSKELAPDTPTGFLTVATIDPMASLVYAMQAGHEFVLPQAPALLEAGEAFVREAHAEGIRVGTWTVDDEDTMAAMFGWQVDAIASNDPRLAVAVRDRVASVQK